MTHNRPRRRHRLPRHPRTKSLHEGFDNSADFADSAPQAPAPPASKPRPSRAGLWFVVTLVVTLVVAAVAAVVLKATVSNSHSPTAAPGSHSPIAAPGSGAVAAPPPPVGCGDPTPLMASMSIRDKLAQLLMVGVTDGADARAVVTKQRVGGIFIASWTDLSMLKDGSLLDIEHSAGPARLAVSVDEEGGRVERLSSLIGSAPPARELTQTLSVGQVYQLALRHGLKMRKLGVTVDFAPVVDVTDAPADAVIGDRSFSANPAVVTEYAGAYAKGLRDAGVLPVLKHFPGHGHASGDSHATEVVTPPLEDLKDLDLLPYRTLVAQAPVGVMIGHMEVPGLTGSDQASLSAAAVTLLRKGSGYGGPSFDGPVFTDDLSSMKAITDRYGVVEAVLKALQAGADTALWTTTTQVPAVLDRLVKAVESNELKIADVEASVRRMLVAKAFGSPCSQ
jgi:beta-N-acetylhexosaminidase